MQAAFGWDDDHLYAFWLSGKFWDREPGSGFGRPGFCRDSGDRSARVKLSRLGLDVGQAIAYVFDFGDEWRVRLKLVELRGVAAVPLQAVFDQRGEAPPQYGSSEGDYARSNSVPPGTRANMDATTSEGEPRGRVSGMPCLVRFEMAPRSGMLESHRSADDKSEAGGIAGPRALFCDWRLRCFRMGRREVNQILKVLWPARRTFHLPEVFE